MTIKRLGNKKITATFNCSLDEQQLPDYNLVLTQQDSSYKSNKQISFLSLLALFNYKQHKVYKTR